jgi:hypothetical protein
MIQTKIAWAGLPVFMAVLMAACGGDQKHAEEPDTTEEIGEAGEAVGTEVKQGVGEAAEGVENAGEETREEVEDKDLDGDGDK